MTKHGHGVALLSGELAVEQRSAVINRFREGKEKVLISTNVALRGTGLHLTTRFQIILSFRSSEHLGHTLQSTNPLRHVQCTHLLRDAQSTHLLGDVLSRPYLGNQNAHCGSLDQWINQVLLRGEILNGGKTSTNYN